MVLLVHVEGCDDSMNCSYSSFSKFRCEIIRGWNEELGELYEHRHSYGFGRDEITDSLIFFILKVKKILDEYDKPFNEGIKLFFYHSDNDGEFTPSECELLLKSFGHVDPEKFKSSDETTLYWLRESYEKWINMIKYAIENNKSILFD